MRLKQLSLLFLALAVGIFAYALLSYWSARNAPLHLRLERQWQEDVRLLEATQKLPPAWFDVTEIEVIGGTPETRSWLSRIEVPLKPKKVGQHKMEVLVVAWEEEGVQGALIQYNITEAKSQNTVLELGRTLILHDPMAANPVKALLEGLRQ